MHNMVCSSADPKGSAAKDERVPWEWWRASGKEPPRCGRLWEWLHRRSGLDPAGV